MRRRFDFSRLSVMVVDDNQAMLQIMRALLRAMGVGDVVLMNDAGAAFGEIAVAEPDVVIADWVMEPMAGGEFIRAIRNLSGQIKFVPIIVLTGHASAPLVRQARDAGADYTLAKPVSLEHVCRAFHHMRDGERAFVQVGNYFGPDRRRKARPFEFADRRGSARVMDMGSGTRGRPAAAGHRPPAANPAASWLVD